jgi:hypothetical protein
LGPGFNLPFDKGLVGENNGFCYPIVFTIFDGFSQTADGLKRLAHCISLIKKIG